MKGIDPNHFNYFSNFFFFFNFNVSSPIHIFSFTAHSMSFNHFTEQIFDDTIIDNKITAISAKDMKNHHDFLYPYNLTVFKIMPTLDNIRIIPGSDADKYESRLSSLLHAFLFFFSFSSSF